MLLRHVLPVPMVVHKRSTGCRTPGCKSPATAALGCSRPRRGRRAGKHMAAVLTELALPDHHTTLVAHKQEGGACRDRRRQHFYTRCVSPYQPWVPASATPPHHDTSTAHQRRHLSPPAPPPPRLHRMARHATGQCPWGLLPRPSSSPPITLPAPPLTRAGSRLLQFHHLLLLLLLPSFTHHHQRRLPRQLGARAVHEAPGQRLAALATLQQGQDGSGALADLGGAAS